MLQLLCGAFCTCNAPRFMATISQLARQRDRGESSPAASQAKVPILLLTADGCCRLLPLLPLLPLLLGNAMRQMRLPFALLLVTRSLLPPISPSLCFYLFHFYCISPCSLCHSTHTQAHTDAQAHNKLVNSECEMGNKKYIFSF